MEKDKRALQIEEEEIASVKKDVDAQWRIIEEDLFSRMESVFVGKQAAGGPAIIMSGVFDNMTTGTPIMILPE